MQDELQPHTPPEATKPSATAIVQQADAIRNYWDQITHLDVTAQRPEEQKGNRRALPIHYLQLSDHVREEAGELLQHADVVDTWMRSATNEDHPRASDVILAQAAFEATQTYGAMQEQRGNASWREELLAHEEFDMTAESPAQVQAELTPTEFVYNYLISAARRDAQRYYEARAAGSQPAGVITDMLRERTAVRMRFIQGDFQGELPGVSGEAVQQAVAEFTTANGTPPSDQDMMRIVRDLEQAHENKESAKELLNRDREHRIAIRRQEKERAANILLRVPHLSGVSELERAAIAGYYRSLAEQLPEDLPEQTSVEQILADKAAGRVPDRVVQVAKYLGLYVDGQNEPTLNDPAIKAANRLLTRIKSQIAGNVVQSGAYDKK